MVLPGRGLKNEGLWFVPGNCSRLRHAGHLYPSSSLVSIYLFIHPHPSSHLYAHLLVYCCPSKLLFTHPSISLSILPPPYPSVHAATHPLIYPSLYPPIYPLIHPSVHPSIHSPIYLSAYPPSVSGAVQGAGGTFSSKTTHISVILVFMTWMCFLEFSHSNLSQFGGINHCSSC